jgi:hypothetical protein
MEGEANLMRSWKVAVVMATLAAGSPGCESRGTPSGVPLAAAAPGDARVAEPTPPPPEPPVEPKIVPFAWRPPGGDEAAYAMKDPEDQHRIVIVGRRAAGAYPVLVALHGQPKRGQSPRDYAFLQRVIDVTTDLVRRGDVEPLVLALPVFRFGGVNWPAFDLAAFRGNVEKVMAAEGLAAKDFYVIGHSGAAGCGGDGLNRAHRMRPVAVGFFDTCLGAGWRDEIRALQRERVPTSILQSVETAGVQPRHLREYDGRYDFGQVFRTVGLAPVTCPSHLPAAPLRPQPYRCAADADGLVRGFLVDTGEGDEAHNALVGVALAYFLREHLHPPR